MFVNEKNACPVPFAAANEILRGHANVVMFMPIPPVAIEPEPYALLQAKGHLLRFHLAQYRHPQDFEGADGIRAVHSLIRTFRRLGVPLERLDLTEQALLALVMD